MQNVLKGWTWGLMRKWTFDKALEKVHISALRVWRAGQGWKGWDKRAGWWWFYGLIREGRRESSRRKPSCREKMTKEPCRKSLEPLPRSLGAGLFSAVVAKCWIWSWGDPVLFKPIHYQYTLWVLAKSGGIFMVYLCGLY